MKTKLYTFLFLVSLSHFAFGQDSLVVVKDTVNIFSVLNGNHPNHKKNNTPIYNSNYILNEQEKDSVLNAVYSSDKTQKLLYRYGEIKVLNAYQNLKNDEIFLPENHIHLVSILSYDLTTTETKQQLLIEKIEYDQTRTTANVAHRFCGTNPLSRSNEIIEINSKDSAISEFMETFNDETFLNFSKMVMVFIPVNKKGKPSRKNETKIAVNEQYLKIRKSKIQKIELLSQSAGTALYGSKAKHGVLLVYYSKK